MTEKAQAERVRRMCLALPDATEKLSHGHPTFFCYGRVFAVCTRNHDGGGRPAAVIPVGEGEQESLIEEDPKRYYYPKYVGVKGWVGIELGAVDDDTLGTHLTEAWKLIAAKAKKKGGAVRRRPLTT